MTDEAEIVGGLPARSVLDPAYTWDLGSISAIDADWEALTADGLIEAMANLYVDAYGDSVVLDRERTGIRWATLPHLFSSFYVYSYGAGTAAAYAIGNQIITEGQSAAERAIAMFAAGDSVYQHEAIELGGADLRDPAVFQSAFDVLAGYVDRLEQLA